MGRLLSAHDGATGGHKADWSGVNTTVTAEFAEARKEGQQRFAISTP
ncbi:MAG: hypothetical protein K0A89_12015 [ANME-2 cluster archaeon]|nr:hypothetical protein [ANME-2 cluster archaeon]